MSSTFRLVPDLFDASGRLIGVVGTRAGRFFSLRLAPGIYLLENDRIRTDDCGDIRVRVRAGRLARARVPYGCDEL